MVDDELEQEEKSPDYFKKLIAEARIRRFTATSTGYFFDRWIFQAIMFLILAWLFFVAYSADFNLDYYQCLGPEESDYTCHNPFYKESNAWKNQEYLPVGEYGKPPNTLFKSIFYVPIGLFAIAFLINHLKYNSRRKKNGNE